MVFDVFRQQVEQLPKIVLCGGGNLATKTLEIEIMSDDSVF